MTPPPPPAARTDNRAAYFYAGGTVLIWSTVATAFKIGLAGLAPLHLLCLAVPVSFLVLLLCSLALGRFAALVRPSGATLRQSALLALLNPFLYYLILFKAYALLPAQMAQPINYTWAIMLALLSVPLLGHRLERGEIPAALISYLGVAIIATGGSAAALGNASPAGVLLALGSTVIWALYWIGNARSGADPLAALTWNFFFASVYLAVALPFLSSYASLFAVLTALRPSALWAAVYVGCFEMGVSFVLWMQAMRRTNSASRISMLIYFSPFLSLVFIRLILGEPIQPATLAGLAAIILGSALQRRALARARRARRAQNKAP